MTQTAHTILRNALALGEKDRATLAGVLIESLETDPDPDVEQAWLREVDRRVAQLDSGHVSTIPLEDVIADISKRVMGKSRRYISSRSVACVS